jgi:hypothetical protein
MTTTNLLLFAILLSLPGAAALGDFLAKVGIWLYGSIAALVILYVFGPLYVGVAVLVWVLLRTFGFPLFLASLPFLWLWWLVCDPAFCLAVTAEMIVGLIGSVAVGCALGWMAKQLTARKARSTLPARQVSSSGTAMRRVGP